MNHKDQPESVAGDGNETLAHNIDLSESSDDKTNVRQKWMIIASLVLMISVGGLAIWLTQKETKSSIAGRAVPEPTGSMVPLPTSDRPTGDAPHPGDLLITLSGEKIDNAHIKTAVVTAQAGVTSTTDGGLRTTGTVEPNAYKEVPVLPVAGGIVREVKAQLGDRVKRGQPLAVIFSTELADAQSEYLRTLAEIEKYQLRYRRTTELVEIGAASKQELEEATAEYKSGQAKLAALKQRLILLGVGEKEIDDIRANNRLQPLISVASPSSGTILTRTVNTGEVIMMGKELFRVADLSTVWVIGQIYEDNFARVRVGTSAFITAPAFPGRTFAGRVSYIAPRVEPQMRTAQVRVEVNNPAEMLKLGMFVDVNFGGAGLPTASQQPLVNVPSLAVQLIGAKAVVFVATDQPGIFAQREVMAGVEANGATPIFSGLSGGERVVTEGSFLLRAESLKLNPTQATTSASQTVKQMPPPSQQPDRQSAPMGSKPSEGNPKLQSVTVLLNAKGFQPASFTLKQGIPARVTFMRQVEATCGTEIVIEEFGIKRDLPLNESVTLEFTPAKTGEFTFACGMDMLRGKVIVK